MSGKQNTPEIRRILPPPPPNEQMTRPDLQGGGFAYHTFQSNVGDALAADPQASRAPGFTNDVWPQAMRPSSVKHDDRPATDPSLAVGGASWPTLKGMISIPGVGKLSFHDRETVQPLSALDPMVRARPTYRGQVEPATTNVRTITYKNVMTTSLGAGLSGAQNQPNIASLSISSINESPHAKTLIFDAQASRAPMYWADNFPQYTHRGSTLPGQRVESDLSIATAGGSRNLPRRHGVCLLYTSPSPRDS